MPHSTGGIRVPGFRKAVDLRCVARIAAALLLGVIVASAITVFMPDGVSRWMRASGYLAAASLAFTAWWWAVQRD